jgi:hypothetical protein
MKAYRKTLLFIVMTLLVLSVSLFADQPIIEITDDGGEIIERLGFGEMDVGGVSEAEALTVTNMGAEDLLIGNPSIAGMDASEFEIQYNDCSGQTLFPPMGNCQIKIIFSPTSNGEKNADLVIPSNDPDTPVWNVALTGTGIGQAGDGDDGISDEAGDDSDGDGVPNNQDDEPDDSMIASPVEVTGSGGKIIIDTSMNPGTYLTDVMTIEDSESSLNQENKPADYDFPAGLVSFKVHTVNLGDTVEVVITWPIDVPQNAKYYKVGNDGFYEFLGAVFIGNTVTLTLTDGGSGDEDETENSVIDEPGGIAVPKTGGGGDSGGGGCFVVTASFTSPAIPNVTAVMLPLGCILFGLLGVMRNL